eukprot:TRINITY_DN2508_c0_g1_i2.p1 TRINITY_DN2508_c0_g1~~TRINITY_DN2508_c0_g1_i2.p1  ORF type:complete len:444 (-),score=87.52 TRINITY_DN2508_c0_g1_i2:344-1675(-)
MDTAEIVKSGRINKLTTQRTLAALFSRQWKERWVVLRQGTVAYYRDRRDTEPKGSIANGFVTAIAKAGTSMYNERCPQCDQEFGFSVLTGDPELDFHFSVETQQEQDEWLALLTAWHHGQLVGAPESRATVGDGSLAHSLGDEKRLQDFCKIGNLGKGGTASVFKVKDRTGALYAMKTIQSHRLNNEAFDTVLKEAETLRNLQSLRHPFLVQFHQWFESEGRVHLILEYCPRGNLYELQKEQRGKVFSAYRSRLYVAETALALQALHSLRLAHSDLKLENLLLDQDGHIKLCDFGFSKPSNDGQGATGYTIIYASPEMLTEGPITAAVDWWALGVVLYECIAGHSPFKTTGKTAVLNMIDNIKNPSYDIPPFEAYLAVPDSAHDLVVGLLDRDPTTRLTSLQHYLDHPFNQGLTEDALMARQVPFPVDENPVRCSGFGAMGEC